MYYSVRKDTKTNRLNMGPLLFRILLVIDIFVIVTETSVSPMLRKLCKKNLLQHNLQVMIFTCTFKLSGQMTRQESYLCYYQLNNGHFEVC